MGKEESKGAGFGNKGKGSGNFRMRSIGKKEPRVYVSTVTSVLHPSKCVKIRVLGL